MAVHLGQAEVRYQAMRRSGGGAAAGRVRYGQLRALGVASATVCDWQDAGYLFWELPLVYAVGHPGRTPESDLAGALLYAEIASYL